LKPNLGIGIWQLPAWLRQKRRKKPTKSPFF
jgi:hypothetical protein